MILKDRVAIVTAAGSGIGRGGAEIMGREGAVVIATAPPPPPAPHSRTPHAPSTPASTSGGVFDTGILADITRKTAVIAMTRQMALDYGPFNIRVNALCPGWVDTPFNDPYIRQMGGRGAIEAYVK